MKRSFCTFLLLAFIGGIYSQTVLSFCASVEQSGYCSFNNTKFIAAQDSSTAKIFMHVKGDIQLNTSRVTYKIFSGGKNNDEKLIDSFEQSIEPNWQYAWLPFYFTAGNKYTVKVYNGSGELMCSKGLELFNWK